MTRKLGKRVVMSYNKYDIAKISFLAIILCGIAYSALTRFVLSGQNQPLLKVEPDFSVCHAVQNCGTCTDKVKLVSNCRNDIDSVFQDANLKCKGYLKNLSTCKNSQVLRQSQCKVELSNVEGCISSVTSKVIEKWNLVASGNS